MTPAEENILYKNMEKKLKKLNKISPKVQEELLEKTKKAIKDDVYPAYEILINCLKRLKPAKETTGLRSRPNLVKLRLKSFSSSSLLLKSFVNYIYLLI